MNYLNAVFWDYPHLTHADNIRKLIENEGDEKFVIGFCSVFWNMAG